MLRCQCGMDNLILRYEPKHLNIETFQLRTKTIQNTQTPEWNEQFCFPGNYPSLCQTMTIQVMKSSSCYAMAEIYLDEICDDGFGLGLLCFGLM